MKIESVSLRTRAENIADYLESLPKDEVILSKDMPFNLKKSHSTLAIFLETNPQYGTRVANRIYFGHPVAIKKLKKLHEG